MATKTLTDDEKNQGMGTSGGEVLDGSATGTGGGSQTGTNWTNLSQYLDNNQGSGAGMANDITRDTQDNVNKIEGQGGQVDAWQTAAMKQVDGGTRQDAYSGTIKNGTTQQVAGIDKDAYGAWNKLGNYWGGVKDSSQSTGYDQVYNDVGDAKKNINRLSSYDGQKAALANTYGKSGGYGNGFQSLDAFALNGDASGQQKLQGFQTQNKSFGQKFDQANSNLNSYIGGAEARGKGIYDKTVEAAKTRYGSIYGEGAKAQTADADSIYADDLLSARVKAPDDSSFAGNTGAQYVTRNKGDAQAYLDPNDLAALNSLSGIDDQDSTNELGAGSKASSGLNWQALMKYAPNLGPGSIAPGSLAPVQNPDGSHEDDSGYTPPEKDYLKRRLDSR